MYFKLKPLFCLFILRTIAGLDSCGNTNKFSISINKEPRYYVPKATYIVGIESNEIDPFKSFSLTTEPKNEANVGQPIGWFHMMPGDTEVQFSPDEINTMIAQSDSPKRDIHTLWTAPSTRNCLIFKATVNYDIASVTCSQQITKTFCALDETSEPSPDDDCCACDEASYSMIFQGLWSNSTHPKNFPTRPQDTHFSDIIGCTHSKNLTMWAEGQYATEGVRQLAEYGSASYLQSEFMEKKKLLRTLIKMSGLWHPNMNSNTSTKFRVDKRHNLLSLGTMLGPSPDWFTGISKLNLCTKNCSWIENKVIDLALYDAGTDNGISYTSPKVPTTPPERIYRITATYPEDPRAPFYNLDNPEVKPVARLHIKRQKIIEKSCSEDNMFDFDEIVDTESENDKRPECRTTNFTDWSTCSASCGKGVRIKMREYVDPTKAKISNCAKRNVLKKLCVADRLCPGDTDDESMILFENNDDCNTTSWSEWSECTATCGIGMMTRTRQFLKRSGYKKCLHVGILEKKKCMEPPCKTTVKEEEFTNCTTTEWSDWSPCSVTCGKGVRIRLRTLIAPKQILPMCRNKVKLEERIECIRTKDCVIDEKTAKEICQLPQEKGLCRGSYLRWYFNPEIKQCQEFEYSGCRGNRNNFLSIDECIKTCSSLYT